MTTPWHRSPEILAALDAYALALAEADALWRTVPYIEALPAIQTAVQAKADCDRVLREAIKAAGKAARTTNGSRAEAPEPQSVGSSDPQGDQVRRV